MLHELLALERPLVGFDLETTGTDPERDRIVQIGVVKVNVDGTVKEWQSLVDPGVPLSEETEAFFASHDVPISNAILKACTVCGGSDPSDHNASGHIFQRVPTFASLAPGLYAGLNGCDVAGYNISSFDVRLLRKEFERVGVEWSPPCMIDAFRMAQRANPRDLSWFVSTYVPEHLRGGFKAHDALHDARQTMHGLIGFLQRHPDYPRTVQKLHDMFFVEARDANTLDPDGKIGWKTINGKAEACIIFGKKHNGKTLREVKALDPGYLRWMLNGEFNPVVKKIAEAALEGRFPGKV